MFKTLDDLPADLTGEVALVRVDLNLPMQDLVVTDDTRVRAAAPTILELADAGYLCAHEGVFFQAAVECGDLNLKLAKGAVEQFFFQLGVDFQPCANVAANGRLSPGWGVATQLVVLRKHMGMVQAEHARRRRREGLDDGWVHGRFLVERAGSSTHQPICPHPSWI